MCGGVKISYLDFTTDCYTFNVLEQDSSWVAAPPLLEAIGYHAAVAVENNIWFTFDSALYDYNTVNGTTVKYTMPFVDAILHCAVVKNGISHVLGVGTDLDEVWANDVAADPSQWTKVATLPIASVEGFSCIRIKDEIYIQGGKIKNGEVLDSTFALNVKTYNMRQLANLNSPRAEGKAMIFACKLALVGGWRELGALLNTIEVYDPISDKWTVYDQELQPPRHGFALIQFEG